MDFSSFFQTEFTPTNAIKGIYSIPLVALSYIIASFASYVALDITERMRNSGERSSKILWLVAGGIAMGMGIWTMHFIGMLAFIMPMPMNYDPYLTILSLILAILVSTFAFNLIKETQVKRGSLIAGGVILGLGIVLMHYTGMASMTGMEIHYIPSIFLLSVMIAIAASEIALWLMLRSNSNRIKIISALVMGLAVSGMHYTGMEAAIFTPDLKEPGPEEHLFNPNTLSSIIALMTISIISIALFASKSWSHVLQLRNKKLIETEAILERKSQELLEANKSLELSIGRIRAILTAAGDGIIVADQTGTIEMINQAVEKIFELPQSQILSHNIFKFIEEKKLKEGTLPMFIEENKEALFEFTLVHQDGKHIPLELNLSSSRIGDELLYIMIMRDVTERKIAEERLNVLNGKLLASARLAGMAEVASCVLHNVGNVLNSINISTQLLLQRDSELVSKTEEFAEVVKLLSEQKSKSSLDAFLKTNKIGQILPEYLSQFAAYADRQQNFSKKELEALNHKVNHIKNIVKMQQKLCADVKNYEYLDLNGLLEDALLITSEKLEGYGIKIQREFQKIASFEGDKVKMLQVLINLLKNAAESMAESRKTEKILILRTKETEKNFQIEIIDNGIGIDPENLAKIFSYGFTTKKDGHGFGLHSSAVAIQQLGGTLNAYSQGKNKGAQFILILPKEELKVGEIYVQS